jgi:hypothetical protein
MTAAGLGSPATDPNQVRIRIFSLLRTHEQAMRPTQPPIQWVPGSFPSESNRGPQTTIHCRG